MSEETRTLALHARSLAEQGTDLYVLLGVDALTSKEDIHRAWRKSSLRYHPDKAGEAFDAEKWELFERARDILSDGDARTVYDAGWRAKEARRLEREAMDREGRLFAEDLEAREAKARGEHAEKVRREALALARERERLAEVQALREQEEKRRVEAEQEMDDLAEARRRVRMRRDEKTRRREAEVRAREVGGGVANGAVDVPGDYVAREGGKMYWQLVCDKLRAVQMVRNLRAGGEDELDEVRCREAEERLGEVRQSIYEAEVQYRQEAPAC